MAQSKYPAYAAPSKLATSDDLPLGEDRRTGMKRGQAELAGLPEAAGAPQAMELRHLRYFAAVADAGSFTHAAEQAWLKGLLPGTLAAPLIALVRALVRVPAPAGPLRPARNRRPPLRRPSPTRRAQQASSRNPRTGH